MNVRGNNCVLGCFHAGCNNVLLELPYHLVVFSVRHSAVSSNLVHFLHKIFVTLCHHQIQQRERALDQEQPSQLNIARYKKAVSSIFLLQLTLVVCYLPHGIVLALISYTGLSLSTFVGRQFTAIYFSLLKLIMKPDSLLLEDQRKKTNCEGHHQTTLLFI